MAQDFFTQNLNGSWKFIFDEKNVGVKNAYYNIDFTKEKWQNTEVPSFLFDDEYNGIGWYSTNFKLDKKFNNKKIAIFFESVDDEAIVYLNGKKIIEHSGYGVRFNKDITEFLYENKQNHLVVKINDTGGAGGLCGDVYLREFQNSEDLLKSEYFSRESTTLPKWMENTLIYELYVRSHGEKGKFTEVTKDLKRLKELGVGCIWFMPIFPVGKIEKKGPLGCPYAIADFKKVNPEYGTMEDFQQLIEEAHKLDIKIILDIACNHSSWDNWLIKKHTEFYTKDEKGNIIFPAGTDWTDVADFNYDNQDLRKYMLEVLDFWVEKIGVDGYRADVAELVPDDFWAEAYNRLVKIKPDIFMLAEGAHPRLHVNGFQMTYAWNLRMTVAKILSGKQSPEFLAEVLKRDHYRYPKNSSRMLFTENHDKKRTPNFFGKDNSILSAVITFSLPGVPMIYGGQEIGEEKTPSLFHKNSINWNLENNIYSNFYKKYFEIRQKNIAFSKGDFVLLKNSKPNKVLSFQRKYDINNVVIITNITDKKVKVNVVLNEKINKIEVLMGNQAKLTKDNTIELNLDSNKYSIIKLK